MLDAPAAELDAGGLRRAVRDGLAEQVEHLGQRSDSFSLPAFRKWARLLTDPRNAKGWPTVFADRVSLFDACLSVYENLEPTAGSDGGNLRGLYAEFLDEAAGLLDVPALGKAAAAYREAAARWHEVAETALPAGREPFAEARRLTDQLQAQVERGDAAQQAAAATAADLWALRDRWRQQFPGDDQDVETLLTTLAGTVAAACDAEEAALGDADRRRPALLSSGFRRPARLPVLPLRGWLGRSARRPSGTRDPWPRRHSASRGPRAESASSWKR